MSSPLLKDVGEAAALAERRREAEVDYAKNVLGLRSWLDGKDFHTAQRALEFAKRHHHGMRKDGVNPSFSHQVWVARYIQTLIPGLEHKEATVAAALLHDTPEDKHFGHEEIETLFGPMVANAVRLLTKKHRGVVVPYEIYFSAMAVDPIASIVKGADRVHNILTMQDADWSVEKQEAYLAEVEKWFLPMLKEARDRIPQQRPAYENIKTLLVTQMAHIRTRIEMMKEIEFLRALPAEESARGFAPV